MKHIAVNQFWNCYDALPLTIRKSADHNFSIIKQYPNHPLLRLMKIENIFSMRVGSRYRALAVEEGETVIWFWIGKYDEYTKLIAM